MNNYKKIDYEHSKEIRDKVLKGIHIPKPRFDRGLGEDYYTEMWWEQLTENEREAILNWVDENLKPIKLINLRHTSYGLKHLCEEDVGFYVHNDAMKKAMAIKGYEMEGRSINWNFNISEKSYKEVNKNVNS